MARKRLIAFVFWVLVWQLLAWKLPNALFSGPIETGKCLAELVLQGAFWRTILNSLARIAAGFLLGMLFGGFAAILAHRSAFVESLLQPILVIMKTVPVACIIVVALIWMRSAGIGTLVAAFVTAPLIYGNLREGFAGLDGKLWEAFVLYRVPFLRRLRFYYFDGLLPALYASCRVGIGMAWKAGVAGEVIGQPDFSIGEQLYLSKLYLNLDSLFAWTIVIVAVSIFCEKLLMCVLNYLERKGNA